MIRNVLNNRLAKIALDRRFEKLANPTAALPAGFPSLLHDGAERDPMWVKDTHQPELASAGR
jgi:hypothetical protein